MQTDKQANIHRHAQTYKNIHHPKLSKPFCL